MLAGALTLGAAMPARGADGHDEVLAAIRAAVGERLGGAQVVRVNELKVRLVPRVGAVRVVATPGPGTKLGAPARFSLRSAGGRWAGEASCIVRVERPHLRTRRAIARGTVLTGADVETTTGDLGDVPLKKVPSEVGGARALRDLPEGAVVLATSVTLPPLVRSGDSVSVSVRVGGLEARGRAVASQTGDLGEIIRVVNPESGRPLKARVVARGEVEVVHGS